MRKILLLFIFLILGFCIYSQENQESLREKKIGNASWYGDEFAGRKTASGEVFDPNKYTAAHKTLPFDTKLKVTNLKNNKSVVVRVNDRGPFVANRVLDLSKVSALELDIVGDGIGKISYEVVSNNTPTGIWKEKYENIKGNNSKDNSINNNLNNNNDESYHEKGNDLLESDYDNRPALEEGKSPENKKYSAKRILQIASFATKKNAEILNKRLNDNNIPSIIQDSENRLFRVVIPNVNVSDIDRYANSLENLGYSGILIKVQ